MSRRPLFAYPARLFPVALPLLLLLSGGARGAERPLVLVSIPPQAWLVKRLAGERVAVESMLADAADPHLFEPDARQARAADPHRGQRRAADASFLRRLRHAGPGGGARHRAGSLPDRPARHAR